MKTWLQDFDQKFVPFINHMNNIGMYGDQKEKMFATQAEELNSQIMQLQSQNLEQTNRA